MDIGDWLIAACIMVGIALAVWIARSRRRDERFLLDRFEQLTNDCVKMANTELESNRAGRLEILRACAGQAHRLDTTIAELAKQVNGTNRNLDRIAGKTTARFQALEDDCAAFRELVAAKMDDVTARCTEVGRIADTNGSYLATAILDAMERSQRDFEERVLAHLGHVTDGTLAGHPFSTHRATPMTSAWSELRGRSDVSVRTAGEKDTGLPGVRTGEAFGRTRLESLLRSRVPSEQYQLGVRMKDDDPSEISAVLWRKSGVGTDPSWLLINVASVGGEGAGKVLRTAARWLREYASGLDQPIEQLILFLPSEAVYEDACRVPRLHDDLLSEYGVVVAGPMVMTTLLDRF